MCVLSVVCYSYSPVDLSWNANRGINPGEDGGSEPSTCGLFRRRRRRRKQQPRRRAAAPRKPRGRPTPSPIFCLLLSPSLLAGGESGSVAALAEDDVSDVRAERRDVDTDATADEDAEERVLDDEAENLVEVEIVNLEETNVLGEREADTADDRVALLRAVFEIDGVALDVRSVVAGEGHCQTDSVGVTCGALVSVGVGSHTVPGPNSLIR